MTTWTAHCLAAPGASLHEEIAGSGPVLALVGHPMGADDFRNLGALLADDHTVLLHDPRGFGSSPLDDLDDDADPDRLADDLSALLSEVTDAPWMRARADAVVTTLHEEGLWPAMGAFIALTGFEAPASGSSDDATPPPAPS